jgi:hypothetical protein
MGWSQAIPDSRSDDIGSNLGLQPLSRQYNALPDVGSKEELGGLKDVLSKNGLALPRLRAAVSYVEVVRDEMSERHARRVVGWRQLTILTMHASARNSRLGGSAN